MTSLPPKKQVALALLQQSSVFIHLDPRREGVSVPAWFKNQAQLVLQIGLNMAVRIPDLEVRDDAVSCTLSFNRTPFYCCLPWPAIYALVGEDGRGMVWPEDVPREVAAQSSSRPPPAARDSWRPAAGDSRRPPADRSRPRLRSVPPPPKAPILPAELASRENGPRSDFPLDAGTRAGGMSASLTGAGLNSAGSSPPPNGATLIGARSREPLRSDLVGDSVGPGYAASGRPASGREEPPAFPLAGELEATVGERRVRRRQLPSYLRVVK